MDTELDKIFEEIEKKTKASQSEAPKPAGPEGVVPVSPALDISPPTGAVVPPPLPEEVKTSVGKPIREPVVEKEASPAETPEFEFGEKPVEPEKPVTAVEPVVLPTEIPVVVPPTIPPTPLITPTVSTRPVEERGFTIQEATEEGAIGVMIYGLKGEGKTVLGMSYPGQLAVLSFDRQALPVKKDFYKNDARIKVYDAIMHWNKASADLLLQSSDTTFKYVNAILDSLEKDRPDVIIIDCSESLQQICEMTMRYRNNIMPFQGVTNRNLWKERNMYVDQVFLRSLKIAKQAVVCTAYVEKDEVIKEGETVIKEDVPRWVGTILTDTRVVIRIKPTVKQGVKSFHAWVESSKDPRYKTGLMIDVTGTNGIQKIWEVSKE